MFLLSSWLPLGCWTSPAFRHRLWPHCRLSWLLGLQMELETAHQLFCWISKMPAIALGPLHLQSRMSQFLLENPLFPCTLQDTFMTYIGLSSQVHMCFSHQTGVPGAPSVSGLSQGIQINAALLRQWLKVMVPSKELPGGKADGESSFFICSPGRAVTPSCH